jgi:uncharacterized membrane protein YeaQ/YmgE (transglycosylase-associated protein family)
VAEHLRVCRHAGFFYSTQSNFRRAKMLIAELVLGPGLVAGWLVAGLIAGALAGKMMENPSYGIMGDLVLGAIGAVLGGIVLGLSATGEPAFWLSVLVAFGGACVLIVAGRIVIARVNAE